MTKEVSIANLQFVPDCIRILQNTTVAFRVEKHSASQVYSSSERNFILECPLFSSHKLYSLDTFHYEFTGLGDYTVTCPFYPHMKLAVSVCSSLEVPPFKTLPRPRQLTVKRDTKPYNVDSGSHSLNETEADLSPVLPDTEDEITRLFMAIKEEAERDHCVPTYQEPETPTPKLTRLLKKRLRERPNILFRYIDLSIQAASKVPPDLQRKIQAFIVEEDIRVPAEVDIFYMMKELCGILRVSVTKKLKRTQGASEYQADLDIEDIEAKLLSSKGYTGFSG